MYWIEHVISTGKDEPLAIVNLHIFKAVVLFDGANIVSWLPIFTLPISYPLHNVSSKFVDRGRDSVRLLEDMDITFKV